MSFPLVVSAVSFTASACLYVSAANIRSQAASIDHSIDQSLNGGKVSEAAIVARTLTGQPIDQSTNQHHIRTLNERLIEMQKQQSTKRSSKRSSDRSTNQSTEQPKQVYAEFIGRSQTDQPIIAPMSGLPCIAYEYTVEAINQSINPSIKLEPTLPLIMNQAINQSINQSISQQIAVPFVSANTTSEVVAHYSSIHPSKCHHFNQPINPSTNPTTNQSSDFFQINDNSGILIDVSTSHLTNTAFITSIDTVVPPPPIDQSINEAINRSISLNAFHLPVYPSETHQVIGYRLIERIVPINATLTVMGIVSINQSTKRSKHQSTNQSTSPPLPHMAPGQKVTIPLHVPVRHPSNPSMNQKTYQPIIDDSHPINPATNQPVTLLLTPPPSTDPRAFVISIIDVQSLIEARLDQANQLINQSMVTSVIGAASFAWWWINRR